MISKIIIGGDICACGKYLIDDESRATVIASQGVRDYDYRLMADDFNINKVQQPGLNKHVVHAILSFPHCEDPSPQEMVMYGKEYLHELGLNNSPYVFVHHNDTRHTHFHIVSSLVDLQGNRVDDSWIGLRGKKAAQAITDKYGLTPANTKNVGKMNLQALNDRETRKFEVYHLINDALFKTASLEQLAGRLNYQGVDMAFKYKRGSEQEIQGISFIYKGYSFKGSEIDRKLSYKQILVRLADNKDMVKDNRIFVLQDDISLSTGTKKQSNGVIIDNINLRFSHNTNSVNYREENESKRKKRKRGPKF